MYKNKLKELEKAKKELDLISKFKDPNPEQIAILKASITDLNKTIKKPPKKK